MESLCQTLGAVWEYISSSAVGQYVSANWAAGLLALSGMVAAAWVAFLFGRKQQKDLAVHADLVAGYQARFALMSQQKTMSNIQKEYLEPKREDVKRHRKLQRYPLLADYPTVPFNGLGYFLKDREGENILSETRAAQDGFFRFLGLLDQRNPRYDEMQRLMVQQGDDYKTNALAEALVKGDTDSLYESAADVLARLGASIKKIDDYLKKRYPKYRTRGLDER